MIPNVFSDINTKLNFDYNNLLNYVEEDNSKNIYNLLTPYENKKKLITDYFKSIIGGYNHVFITKHLGNNLSQNILLPLLNDWNGKVTIDNIVIISHPLDSQRIAKKHIKKAPIFKSVVNDSVISTTDNQDWKNQRYELNNYFLPHYSLKKLFDLSKNRALECNTNLKDLSNNYKKPINMSDYFLNETQAQLQLVLFGFNKDFEQKTNKKIRDVFAGINTDYSKEFALSALNETLKSRWTFKSIFSDK